MSPSQVYDAELHRAGTPAAAGQCSHHLPDGPQRETCTGEAVVSFQDSRGEWQSGCSAALRQLVEAGEIEPLGQGA
jgi:hypothetical protein